MAEMSKVSVTAPAINMWETRLMLAALATLGPVATSQMSEGAGTTISAELPQGAYGPDFKHMVRAAYRSVGYPDANIGEAVVQ